MHVLSIHLETPVESQSVWGAQCPNPHLVTFCSRWRATEEARCRRRTERRHLSTSLHRLRVNTRGSICPNTIVSDTIRKLSVSFSHRLRVNGASICRWYSFGSRVRGGHQRSRENNPALWEGIWSKTEQGENVCHGTRRVEQERLNGSVVQMG